MNRQTLGQTCTIGASYICFNRNFFGRKVTRGKLRLDHLKIKFRKLWNLFAEIRNIVDINIVHGAMHFNQSF